MNVHDEEMVTQKELGEKAPSSAHGFSGHCWVLHSRMGIDVRTQCAVEHGTEESTEG